MKQEFTTTDLERFASEIKPATDSPVMITKEPIQEQKKKNAFDQLFMPTWDNKPPEKPPVLKLNNTPILSYQNISCIIAQPGAGKSSTMESIVSAVINPQSDNLGFLADVLSVLYIDCERTETDVWNSFYRTMKRAKVQHGTNLENVKIVSFRNIKGAENRRNKIVELLQFYKSELLILDGVGSLVVDTNSLSEAENLTEWIRHTTSVYKTSIFTTLHPNKGSVTPRGHLGSEMLREAENVLLIEVKADKTRNLTSDFAFGKTRNGAHANSSFAWNDELMMFTSCEYVEQERKTRRAPVDRFEHQELLTLISITHSKQLTATETIEKLTNYLKSNISYVKTDNNSIKTFLRYLVDNNYLISTRKEGDKRTVYYIENKRLSDSDSVTEQGTQTKMDI